MRLLQDIHYKRCTKYENDIRIIILPLYLKFEFDACQIGGFCIVER